LLPAEKVLMHCEIKIRGSTVSCNIKKHIAEVRALQRQPTQPKRIQPIFNLPTTQREKDLEKMNVTYKNANAKLLFESADEKVNCWQETVPTLVGNVVDALPAAVAQGRRKAQGQKEIEVNEKSIDVLARKVLQLSGFDSRKTKLRLVPLDSRKFMFANANSGCVPDDVVIQTKQKDYVIVCEYKAGKWTQGHIGQLFGEGVCCLYHNFKKHKQLGKSGVTRSIHMVRVINTHVSFFEMKANGQQIKDICENRVVPKPKLVMLHDVPAPLGPGSRQRVTRDNLGFDLCDMKDRAMIISKLATLRAMLAYRKACGHGTDGN